ncbi:MAG: nucleoside-diphosphate kinase [Parcubacteria group bacterium]|nr:nucleoside-diphosphate kinase [Parcubacteria group bacterium]
MKLEKPELEMTYCMVKPDGVTRGLIGEIIRRMEQRGLKIIAIEMIQPSHDEMDKHYPTDEAWIRRVGQKTLSTYEKYGYDAMEELGTADDLEIGKMVREWLINFMISAPVVKMVVQGVHAIDMVRKLAGHTIPSMADVGTIRGDYSMESAVSANKGKRAIMNLVHASETPEEAEHEIAHWFNKDQIHAYNATCQ